jgi:predicted metalloprotease
MPVFNRKGKLDTSQVEDRRGQRMGPMPGGLGALAGGGGVVGIVITLAVLLLSGGLTGSGGGGLGGLAPLDGTTAGDNSEISADCQTGADAQEREDCRMVAYVNSIQEYWDGEYTRRGDQYEPSTTVFFSGQVSTGCGTASSAVGPFYCPRDAKVYIDLGFFDLLRERFGAQAGAFAPAYVVAHEYGHHIQDIEGALAASQRDPQGEDSGAVRVELQADCFAGVWAKNAADTGIITALTRSDIADALDAAQAVGDDRIQEQTQGQVNPETWTHGSSEQRQEWFSTGYDTGDPDSCDTFGGQI